MHYPPSELQLYRPALSREPMPRMTRAPASAARLPRCAAVLIAAVFLLASLPSVAISAAGANETDTENAQPATIGGANASKGGTDASDSSPSMNTQDNPPDATKPPANPTIATALFAGGCFWCMEPPYDDIDGVIDTLSGYAGGTVENPTYKQVTGGGTGHLEVLQVRYDATVASYEKLLDVFWRNVDFTNDKGQFCDRGPSYQPAIFALNDEQRALAEESRSALKALFPELNTPIRDAATFYPAESYHQDYYRKNSVRYKYYRWSCGRDERLADLLEERRERERRAQQAEQANKNDAD